jgi:hypothetical protein
LLTFFQPGKWLVPRLSGGTLATMLESSNVPGQCEHWSVDNESIKHASEPTVYSGRFQCLLPDASLLDANGKLFQCSTLRVGQEVLGLTIQGNSMHFKTVKIRSVLRLPNRERDVCSFQLSGDNVGCSASHNSIDSMTTSHSVLAFRNPFPDGENVHADNQQPLAQVLSSAELTPGRHLLLVFQMKGIETEHCSTAKLTCKKTSVKSCEVVQFQLNESDAFVLMKLNSGSFIAISSSPEVPTMRMVSIHGFIEVQEITEGKPASTSVKSEPWGAVLAQPRVLRTIRPPHNDACKSICRFYFNSKGCKSGKVCPRCHHDDHRNDHTRAHHGRKR